jgi:Ca2+-binding RTX toxin-like protein
MEVEETITATVSQAGELTIASHMSKAITVFCGGREVKINGIVPGSGTASCASISSLVVNGGPGPDHIYLDGVRRTLFPNLVSVTVNGGAGDDIITASEFKDTLLGGPGDDAFVGVEAEDLVDGGPGQTFFVEATESTGPPLGVQGQGSGASGNTEAPAPLAPPLGTTIEGLDFNDNATPR